jgi:hypothetical protein
MGFSILVFEKLFGYKTTQGHQLNFSKEKLISRNLDSFLPFLGEKK